VVVGLGPVAAASRRSLMVAGALMAPLLLAAAGWTTMAPACQRPVMGSRSTAIRIAVGTCSDCSK
jgi:hypothetical protein